jgi:uncharacterized RDD family membrane protein YckC
MRSSVATLAIRTPEGIRFDLLLAGIVPRFAAWSIDVAAVFVLLGVMDKTLALLKFLPGLQLFIVPILYFLVWIGYGIFFEWLWRGQTPGKRLFRLRVMDVQGLRLQFSQVGIRNLLRVVDALPAFYFVGGLVCSLTRKCQRLGDVAANTIVVRYPKIEAPEIEDLIGNKFNSLRAYPHLEARLRHAVTPAEAALALEALRRARTLDSEAAIPLFEQLANHFKELVEFPPEATEFISPEQYIRNVVEIVYTPPEAANDRFLRPRLSCLVYERRVN